MIPPSNMSHAEVADRLTRYVQDVVPLRACGFKSLLRQNPTRKEIQLGLRGVIRDKIKGLFLLLTL